MLNRTESSGSDALDIRRAIAAHRRESLQELPLREFPSAAAETTVVYLARLFAMECLPPQFCALDMIEHACDEAGIEAAALESLRGDVRSAPVLV